MIRRLPIPAVLLAVCLAPAAERAPDTETRLHAVERHIRRLQQELGSIESRESGILGQLARIDTEITLRSAQVEQAQIRLDDLAAQIARRETTAEAIREAQGTRERYLAFRLREMYKQGPGMTFRRSLITGEVEEFLSGLRYAAFLSERDTRVLGEYRADALRLEEELAALAAERERQEAIRDQAASARRRLLAGRRERTGLLTRLREDAGVRKSALGELEQAAGELTTLVQGLGPGNAPELEMHKFRGLLDLPVDGRITEGFGEIVHPRFKTRVPHPGLDIEADAGRRITGIFDGTVVYAAWLRGYGLTVILDHGSGLVSIYAHASVLLVERGEQVLRGQVIGQVGETGSLKGPFLYFELRENGRAIDPSPWFR